MVRIYEMRNGAETRLKFIADSHPLSLNLDEESVNIGDAKRFVEDQVQDARTHDPRKAADYSKVVERLRAAGNDLWTRVVPEPVRRGG